MPVSYSSRHPGPAAKFMGPIGADALVGGSAPVLRDAGTIPSDGLGLSRFVRLFCQQQGITISTFLRIAGFAPQTLPSWEKLSHPVKAEIIAKVRAGLAEVRAGGAAVQRDGRRRLDCKTGPALARQIRKLCFDHKITLSRFFTKAGVPISSLASWERGASPTATSRELVHAVMCEYGVKPQ